MGLDMYLYTNSKKLANEMNEGADDWSDYKAKSGLAIYWRKANAVHSWFVTNVQVKADECATYEVSVEELCQLHDTCKEVLESTELVDGKVCNGSTLCDDGWKKNMEDGKVLKDPSKAKELMPTTSGFFFGSTDYDQYYWEDLEYTVEQIDRLLMNIVPDEKKGWNVVHKDEPDWYVKFYYHSSW